MIRKARRISGWIPSAGRSLVVWGFVNKGIQQSTPKTLPGNSVLALHSSAIPTT